MKKVHSFIHKDDLIHMDLSKITKVTNRKKMIVKKKTEFHKTPNVHYMEIKTEYLIKNYPNYKLIENPIEEWDSKEPVPVECYPRLRQRKSAWLSLPHDFRGSDLGKLTGLFLEKACKRFDFKYQKKNLNEFVDCILGKKKDYSSIQYILDWGTYHENNGLKALLDLFKDNCWDIQIKEIGTCGFECDGMKIISSPDGIFTANNIEGIDCEIKGIIEIKCKNPYIMNGSGFGYFYKYILPDESVKYYYIPQIQMEMWASGLKWAFVVLFTLNGTRILLIQRDDDYIKMILDILKFIRRKYTSEDSFLNVESGVKNPFNEISDLHNDFIRKTSYLNTLYQSNKTKKWFVKPRS